MIGVRDSRAAAFAAALLLTACSGSRVAPPRASTHPSATTVVSCEPTIAAPEGFRPTKTSPVPVASHTGVRRSYVDGEGRILHISAGITGEFGEGADEVQQVSLSSGRRGTLYGAGEIWILVWREDGVCGDLAIIGDGFSQQDFLDLLDQVGVT